MITLSPQGDMVIVNMAGVGAIVRGNITVIFYSSSFKFIYNRFKFRSMNGEIVMFCLQKSPKVQEE